MTSLGTRDSFRTNIHTCNIIIELIVLCAGTHYSEINTALYKEAILHLAMATGRTGNALLKCKLHYRHRCIYVCVWVCVGFCRCVWVRRRNKGWSIQDQFQVEVIGYHCLALFNQLHAVSAKKKHTITATTATAVCCNNNTMQSIYI